MAIHHESFLIDAGGAQAGLNAELVREHLDKGEFFWLDLHRPKEDELDLLRDPLMVHHLAFEDTVHFGQRAKLEAYDDFILLVAYGAAPDRDGLVEVHCYFSKKWLVTVHRDDCPAFEDLRKSMTGIQASPLEPALALYRVVDALADSFFPEMAKLDDRIDALENDVLRKPDDAQLQQVFRLKRRLVHWRKAITPERDLFAQPAIPGMTAEVERHYRNVYDHLIRISDMIDSYRDLLTGVMDIYLSMVSNRTNEIMKRLTIVATIFMPLTFIVGFFGMNFPWMVRNVVGFWPFFWLAVVCEVVVVVAMLIWFRRRQWI